MMFFGGARPIGGYSKYDVPHDGLALAMHESFCDWECFQGQTKIMMANMYENWIMDTKHSESEKIAMYEGVLGDAWEKIKSFFRAIAEKIKSWFNAAIKYFRTVFSSNSEFLKRYKEEIENKEDEKFQFKAHKWDWDIADKQKDVAKKILDEAISEFQKAAAAITRKEDAETAKSNRSSDTKIAKKNIDGEMYRGLKGADAGNGGMSKYKTAFAKAINGGEPKDCKGFGSKSLSKDKMIEFMENGSDKTSEISDLASDITDKASSIADEVDKVVGERTKDDSSDKSTWSSAMNAAADVVKYRLSYATATANVYKEQLSMCINECSSVLRSFARYSVKEESGSGYRQRRGDVSLMEAWTSNW